MTSPRVVAAKKGERKYHGKPCKTCGGTERYVINAGCVSCLTKSKTESHSRLLQAIQEAKAGV